MDSQTPNQPTNDPTPKSEVQPPTNGTPTPSVSPSKFGERNKTVLIVAGVIIVLLILGGLTAALGGKKSDKKTTAPKAADYSATTNPADKPAASLTKTPLAQSITTDLGYKIDVSELVRNYPAKYPEKGQETVMVKVTITEIDSKYTGASPYATDFKLLVGGKEYGSSTIVGYREATDAGYPPPATESATKDKPTSGYLTFDIPTGSGALTLRHTQKERKILSLGNDPQTLPAKNYDVPLH